MGFQASCPGESVIVAMDANRNRENLAALNWALTNVVRPKDTVLVLGILCKVGRKSSCFPLYIWEKLEFSGQGDMTPKVLEEEIVKKREKYQAALQPFYRQCKRNEVKLEVKLAAGFSPKIITIEEAQSTNTRWIVLDSHLKKDRVYIYGHIGCNIAVMKSKNVPTIMPSVVVESENKNRKPSMGINQLSTAEDQQHDSIDATQEESPISPPSNPCWYPLSWRFGFPRSFAVAEIEGITGDFAGENLIFEEENMQVYHGILMESPVLVKCFVGSDECFWSELRILAKVRHRNILNLVGYCCTDTAMFLLRDFPCNGSLDKHLQCDELAKKFSWKARWDIALGIGSCLRYLQEECLNGPIMHIAISSSCIVLSHNFSPLVSLESLFYGVTISLF
eukprot:TRINITY_DN6064_c0_g1_i4.p1 TRINITY_DN6064_c0_g1~~TRINITY_DN6064_c0_g1_i4.p1  ORF type:complete len:393 (-),score=69.27 TRINITY_DN6064_c0_g1_i4:34-1212(-)